MRFFAPQGIGDSLWALHKVRAIAAAHGADRIDLLLASSGSDEIQRRSLPFLERFPFLFSVGLANHTCLKRPDAPLTPDGYWDYVADGPLKGIDVYCLMPNAALERGIRLEDWLPEFSIDWNTMGEFSFLESETRYAEQLRLNLGPFAVFYLGPEEGNTTNGHNRGGLWSPQEWADLSRLLEGMGLQIVVVGAAYDKSYFERHLKPLGVNWRSFIGEWHIGQTLAVVKAASLTVAYQSGIGICSHYLGTPTAQWWRAKGNSASTRAYISFEESMAHCWTNPLHRSRYLPLIYGRCSPADIAAFAKGFVP